MARLFIAFDIVAVVTVFGAVGTGRLLAVLATAAGGILGASQGAAV
jgi:hypothetical protein